MSMCMIEDSIEWIPIKTFGIRPCCSKLDHTTYSQRKTPAQVTHQRRVREQEAEKGSNEKGERTNGTVKGEKRRGWAGRKVRGREIFDTPPQCSKQIDSYGNSNSMKIVLLKLKNP